MKVEIHQDGEGWSSGGKGDAEVEVRLFDGIYPHTSAYIQLNAGVTGAEPQAERPR